MLEELAEVLLRWQNYKTALTNQELEDKMQWARLLGHNMYKYICERQRFQKRILLLFRLQQKLLKSWVVQNLLLLISSFFFFFLPFSVEDYNRTRWFIANGCLATLLRDKILQNMSKISYRKKETKNLKTTFITQKGDNQHFGRSDGGGGSFWLGSFPSWTTHAILKPQLRWTSKWQCINQTPVQSSSIIIIRLFLRKSDFCAVTSYCV